MHSVGNIPPKNPDHILELSDDGDSPTKKLPKKTQNGGGMKLKPRPTVIESSSDESNHNNKKKTRTINKDTEPEEEETPEEEVGKLLHILLCSTINNSNIFEERMAKDWTSPIYGFFQARPTIKVIDGRRCHEFQCAAPLCKGKGSTSRIVRRYLDKGDRNSTSNMHKHAKNCWGEEIVSKALETKGELSVDDVRKNLGSAKLVDGSITASFERKGKGVVTFSTRQHTYMETRLVDIRYKS